MPNAVAAAHEILAAHVRPGDAVIDATAGNGHDTLYLARLTGPGGQVFAFDVQPEAIAATRARLDAGGSGHGVCTLIHAGHETMALHIPAILHGRIAAAVFNLGYLPGGDKNVITSAGTTVPAMEASLSLLRPGGVMVLVIYTGHPGGAAEEQAIESFVHSLDLQKWTVFRSAPAPTLRPAPRVLSVVAPVA